MNMVNDNGDHFELIVAGYWSEYKQNHYYQNNWLKGEIILSNNGVKERIILEFLQVEELVNLVEWLNQLERKDKRTSTIFDFIDPKMRFRLWRRGKFETVRFIYHSVEKDTYSWEMIFNELNMTSFKRQLNEILFQFPIR